MSDKMLENLKDMAKDMDKSKSAVFVMLLDMVSQMSDRLAKVERSVEAIDRVLNAQK